MRYIVILLFACTFLSCQSDVDKFYKTTGFEDTRLLPLIKPYCLMTPISTHPKWHLRIKANTSYANLKYIGHSLSVCQVNVVDKIIFGNCDRDEYKEYNYPYFVIIPNEDVEKTFEKKEDWDKYLKERGVNSSELYDVLEVYNAFKSNNKSLPWYEQIKN